MPSFLREHIVVNNRTETLPYTSNASGRSKVVARTGLDREAQGNHVRERFEAAVAAFREDGEDAFVYLIFRSALGFLLDLDKFDDKKGNYRLASYKKIQTPDENAGDDVFYEAAVYLNKKAVSKFLKKIEQYIHKNTPGTTNPKHQTLIANIEDIRAATLESFWQEPEIPFPVRDENTWWEVWLSRNNQEGTDRLEPVFSVLGDAGIQIGHRQLRFPEHFVFLIRGTANQLASSILYTDRLAEIRRPKETADFFTYLDRQEQTKWIDDLRRRVDNLASESIISICLLDTGVNHSHPLLQDLILEKDLDTVDPQWTKSDSHHQGHGTQMAGLALYGDLTESLASAERIQICYHLESIKLIEHRRNHDPELYGAVTQEAISRGVIMNPGNKRIVCMAVTSRELIHKGRPSSWSAAVDQIAFGSVIEPNNSILMFLSSGNVDLEERINFPIANEDYTIEDPAQAFNAVTVGAYTLKDKLDLTVYPGVTLLASRGQMAPCNTTSLTWENDWCRKPDIVMEGGNQAILNNAIIDLDSLQLLSIAKGGLAKPLLSTFGDTSGATALASRFAAELYHRYPHLWPETIRALMIHSADWTPAMLGNRTIVQLSSDEQLSLISQVGYGVPNLQKAIYSANNSLCLIAQRDLKPFKLEESIVKTDEFHLFDFPWPSETLQELFAQQVMAKITLSYFVEPNPGNKQYDLSASYRSHGLRFKMIDSNESLNAFKARVSKAMKEDDYEKEGHEHWLLGDKVRNKGSIHKDIWQGTAADLATRNRIAVYPVGGWWKSRKKKQRYNHSIRYSLIMSIESPNNDIDIYTPVLNQVSIEV
jgi:hypothetical protein